MGRLLASQRQSMYACKLTCFKCSSPTGTIFHPSSPLPDYCIINKNISDKNRCLQLWPEAVRLSNWSLTSQSVPILISAKPFLHSGWFRVRCAWYCRWFLCRQLIIIVVIIIIISSVVSGFCQDSTRILPGFYQDSARILPEFLQDFNWWFCQDSHW